MCKFFMIMTAIFAIITIYRLPKIIEFKMTLLKMARAHSTILLLWLRDDDTVSKAFKNGGYVNPFHKKVSFFRLLFSFEPLTIDNYLSKEDISDFMRVNNPEITVVLNEMLLSLVKQGEGKENATHSC